MRIGISSDESNSLTEHVVRYVRKKGHRVIKFGSISGKSTEWVDASVQLAKAVASGRCDSGILFCWTGTGACIAANKVNGIRAALCTDSEEASGARRWNNANILVMSIRLTSDPIADEIIDAWFREKFKKDAYNERNIKKLNEIESGII